MKTIRRAAVWASVVGACLLAGCESEEASSGAAGSAGAAGLAEAGPDSESDQSSPGDAQPDTAPDSGLDGAVEPVTRVIQVLTIDDFHGQIDPLVVKSGDETTWWGGLGYLSAWLKAARAENPDTIILNSGDALGASPPLAAYATDLPEEPTVESFNLLGLTASCLGNHDFDRGTAHLKKLMGLAEHAYVGANLEDPQGELPKLVKPYHLVTLGDDTKVAIVGISHPDTATMVLAGQMGYVTVTDPVVAANEAAATARAAGAQVVLGVAHIGVHGQNPSDPTTMTGPLIELAGKLKGFDYLHGGGTPFEFFQYVGDTLVAQGPARGHSFYKTLITLTDGKVSKVKATEVEVVGKRQRPLKADAGVPEGGTLDCSSATCPSGFDCVATPVPVCEQIVMAADPAAEALVGAWKKSMPPVFDQQIGFIDTTWVRDGRIERAKESLLGDLVADAMLAKHKPDGAQIALVTGGALRDPLPSTYVSKVEGLRRIGCSNTEPCQLVVGDVYSVLPEGFSIVPRTLTGSILWKVLEHAVSALPSVNDGVSPTDFSRRFLQVAGLKFTWQASAAPGSRVQSVFLVDGATETSIANDESASYKVLLSDHMNGGGDGYTLLKESVPTPALGVMADAVILHIKDKVTLTGGYPPQNPRIIEIP